MNRAVILFLCASAVSLPLVGQGNITKYDLPVKVKRLMEKICCSCVIHDLWMPMDYSFYNFEYVENGETYHTSIDSSGRWDRTFQEVSLDSIPMECIAIYETQKSIYDAKVNNDNQTNAYAKEEIAGSDKFKMERVLKEYDELTREGYYDFVIQKPNGLAVFDNDTSIMMDTEHIKINFYCELLNNDGKIVKYNDGKMYTSFNSNASLAEYLNGEKDGLYIQYFNFPDEVASVEYYVKGVPRGPYYYYYRNGNLSAIGYYGSEGRVIDKWSYDGIKMLKKVEYDTLSNTYMDRHMNPLNGKCLLEGKDVYFTNGRIDSVVIDVGKHTGYHDNFIDSVRTLKFYSDDGLIKNERIIKMSSINVGIKMFEGFAYIVDQSKFADRTYEIAYFNGTKIVMEMGAYENYKKVGKWYYYNEKGRRIRTERYTND